MHVCVCESAYVCVCILERDKEREKTERVESDFDRVKAETFTISSYFFDIGNNSSKCK